LCAEVRWNTFQPRFPLALLSPLRRPGALRKRFSRAPRYPLTIPSRIGLAALVHRLTRTLSLVRQGEAIAITGTLTHFTQAEDYGSVLVQGTQMGICEERKRATYSDTAFHSQGNCRIDHKAVNFASEGLRKFQESTKSSCRNTDEREDGPIGT